MKKLIFSGTGYPVSIKTLEYLQDNTLNAVSAFAKSKVNYEVVWGMDYNPRTTRINDGAFIYNGEIIPFIGGEVIERVQEVKKVSSEVDRVLDKEVVGKPTITIDEVVENESFNTNPNSVTAVESLPAYSTKIARLGTGGLHTFPLSSLKRYKQQVIIDSGVTIGDKRITNDMEYSSVIFCEHKELTDEELANSMIIYTVTRDNIRASYLVGASHNLLYRFHDKFGISISMILQTGELPMVYWQIVKLN